MAERLIQIVIPAANAVQMSSLIAEAGAVELRHDNSGAMHLFTVLVPAEQVETVLDPIQAALGYVDGFHAFVLPVEAALPAKPQPKKTLIEDDNENTRKASCPTRISREELYADLSDHARITRVSLAMTALSTIVAAIGLSQNSVAVIIGAMVMAPLLGPNMALSLATTLGDTKLAAGALRTTATGILLAALVAIACGFFLHIDPDAPEIFSRTYVGAADLIVALAAGIAGALAFTTGVPASLIGVMVAVALLPPLVVCAMLLTSGHTGESLGALLLLLCNVISINLAGVGTFLLQGVSPRRWWEAERSKRISRRVLVVWILLLAVVAILIYLSNISKSL